MATDSLGVYLSGLFAGTLTRGQRDRLTLTYDEIYRNDPRATPLSCSLPLTAARHHHDKVAPFLWGLLPDNEQVLERWSRQFRVSARRPLDLLEHVGRDLPGAIEIRDPELTAGDLESGIEWLDESAVAEELRRVREDQAAWLAPSGAARWSLAGAHAKVALIHLDGRWGRSAGGTPTNRILKPAIPGLTDHDINEHLCLTAAGLCGLRVAPSIVTAFGEERAVVVTRYDRRTGPEGVIERIHQEDLCQALGVHPSHRYESDGGPSAARVGRLLSTQVGGESGRHALWQFFSALAFNWLIAAPDAHAKNYSVLHLAGAVRLAPLYDMGSALPYAGFYPPKVKLAMRIGGHYRVGAIGAPTFAREAKALSLPQHTAVDRVRELAERVPAAFVQAREGLSISGRSADFADVLVEAVAANAAKCAARL
jgi:serine/threonine-protein kinase HipA